MIFAAAAVAACDDDGEISGVAGLSSTPVETVKLAFIGDQGYGVAARATLGLMRAEAVDAVVHLGDFDYVDHPPYFISMYNDILGPNVPLFVAVGNHDVPRWDSSGGYQDILERRTRKQDIEWDGELGVMASLEYRGIFMVFGAPKVIGSDHTVYAPYFEDRLNASDAIWKICAWHKNEKKMQIGSLGDAIGWDLYETCRENGALMGQGHDHTYCRTHLLSNMRTQTIASTSDTLVLKRGQSFSFVSGLGGRSIFPQVQDHADYWASYYTADQGANYGVLFGVFGVGGRRELAHFYFKDIDGRIVDEFWVISELGRSPSGTVPPVER
jgi:hypothetical protein